MKEAIIYQNRESGEVNKIQSKGLLLGFTSEGNYEDVTINLNPTDCIYMVTDGIIESRNPGGDQFGTTRLNDVIKSISPGDNAIERLKQEFDEFTGKKYEDDISLIRIMAN